MLPEVAELMAKLESERKALLDVLTRLSERDARHHPEGEWSAKQQLCHLTHEDRWWVDFAAAAQKTPGIALPRPDPKEEERFRSEMEEADSKPMSFWLERVHRTRAETMRRIRKLDLSTPEALAMKGIHYQSGEMTVLQLVRATYRHDRVHREQILAEDISFRSKDVGTGSTG